MDGRDPTQVLYSHTQAGRIIGIELGVAAAAQAAALVDALRKRQRRAWLQVPGLVVTGLLAYAFSALTVEITSTRLSVCFRHGLLRRTIDLADVRDVERITIPWYWGWGIRRTPMGWLYNVQGRDAVRLGLEGGRGFLVGTDEPARLAAAVEAIRPQ